MTTTRAHIPPTPIAGHAGRRGQAAGAADARKRESVTAIAGTLGVSRATVYRVLAEEGDETS
ncbi:helix-turn-helix domain-containing protein [Mycobacterium sp.]|uniref:helix-turn-helix domain-containing protein n=1 Tax=Mycobacterium sp. TaxID=1785 RepID=UPI003F9551D3